MIKSLESISPRPLFLRHFARFSTTLAAGTCLLGVGLSVLPPVAASDGKVVIDPIYGIGNTDRPLLAPPHVEPVSACADHVYVDSFMAGADLEVFVNGANATPGGSVSSTNAFEAVALTKSLQDGDAVTARQKVNGVTSAPSLQVIVGAAPTTLAPPTVGKDIFACGRIVPVNGLASGVSVEVYDLSETPKKLIGTGSTPNDWGADWAPVSTTGPLVAGHQIQAQQSVTCKGGKTAVSVNPQAAVPPELSSVNPPVLVPPVVGSNVVTLEKLLTGSAVTVSSGSTTLAQGYAVSASNFVDIKPDVTATDSIVGKQQLCNAEAASPPAKPTAQLSPPLLLGPICPGQQTVYVAKTALNANLVLLKNGGVVSNGGAGPGDTPLDIIPTQSFANGDKVEVVEYLASSPSDVISAASNTVTVECHDVLTYHNDTQRTGWNSTELALTPAAVGQKTFGLIASASLDDDNDQVDAQVLIVVDQNIEGAGAHTVAYVATENNTVYAFDALTGQRLKKVNLGAPVAIANCNNNAMVVGINGTPTIDLRSRTLYVIAYVTSGGQPVFQLHALDLATLQDKPGSPASFTPSYTGGGAPIPFLSTYQRQRSALLQANGNIYAGFASYCDMSASQSRGWVLGFNQSTLKPVSTSNELINKQPAGGSFYLSSVWMSGYGIAADPDDGSLFVSTGNTGYTRKGNQVLSTYDSVKNLGESVVKLSPDLSSVLDYFTPSNYATLDADDGDLGAGGVMVIPDQTSQLAGSTRLVVAAGKQDGSYAGGANFFLVNRETGKMGELANPDVPSAVPIGECHCGPSYFTGADGIGRVVSSGDSQVTLWKLQGGTSPKLAQEASAQLAVSGQDGGFFTSISSNGTTADTQIIWAVDRPIGAKNACAVAASGWPPAPDEDPGKCFVSLYAFSASPAGSPPSTTLQQLGVWQAGTWAYTNGNTNIVPTVANGMVYVASYKQLQIFGLTHELTIKPRKLLIAAAQTENTAPPAPSGPTYWGTVTSVDDSRAVLKLRDGRSLQVDVSGLPADDKTTTLVVGRGVGVAGAYNAQGVLAAKQLWRAKGPAIWGEDRDK
ncbi:hypothetical protein [Bradyrhizobium sp.]|uniref:hypothetical protein n=1 Tax=Bradyrhizobium sp. TaxID=376 RepID=UPI003C48C9A1